MILGGTGEASALARLIVSRPGIDAVLSLAGRTSVPRAQPLPVRSGGFGGAAGLQDWLRRERTDAVIDATHPFAAQISANAVAACAGTGVPLGTIIRPPWQSCPGDQWLGVADMNAAADALGPEPQRAFLTLGRQELSAFARAPQHSYVTRLIELPEGIPLPPRIDFILARGPFEFDAERRFLEENRITILVSKNAGGPATYPKISAARSLGLPVIMVAQPDKPAGVRLDSPEAALGWLEELSKDHGRSMSGSERRV